MWRLPIYIAPYLTSHMFAYALKFESVAVDFIEHSVFEK
jgi:hypothetical protein